MQKLISNPDLSESVIGGQLNIQIKDVSRLDFRKKPQ